MFRTYSIAAATAVSILASPVLAGGMAEPAVPAAPVAPPMAVAPDWTGFYAGVQLEFLNGEDVGFGTDADFDGNLYGVFAGYRYDLGQFVVGVEVDYMQGSGDYIPLTVGGVAGIGQALDFNSLTRLGVEVGYDAGAALIYGTAGFARLDISLGANSFDDNGYFYGVGMDFRVTDNVTVGGEILMHDFSDFVIPTNDLSATTVGINVAFTF